MGQSIMGMSFTDKEDNMQIVIDIPEGNYKTICETKDLWETEPKNIIYAAIANGTPLPKGHGRLVDANGKPLPNSMWIPVSERLPEENGQYLITVKYKHINDNYEDIYAEHGEWMDGKWDMFCFGHCGQVETILAWMPLPQPYKAESEEKHDN